MSLHSHTCDNCDAPVATVFCTECHMYLCGENECDFHIHQPRGKRSHRRKQLDATKHTSEVIEIHVGASHLPILPTLTETDPLITLSVARLNKSGARQGEYEYLDRTELLRDEHNPYFQKVFVLDYHKGDDLCLQLSVFDGDLEHHTRAFHFPKEKDLIGSAVARLNDVLILETGEQVAGFHPHHERDQNRFFYPLRHSGNAELDSELQGKQSQVWIEAYQFSSEVHEDHVALAPPKLVDGLHQSASTTLQIQQAIVARSRAGSRIASKKGSGSGTPLKTAATAAAQTGVISIALNGNGAGPSSKRLSVPEEAAEKMMLAAKKAALNGGESEEEDEAEDQNLKAAGLVHYLPSEHLFNPDLSPDSNPGALSATLKHLLGRIQNLEWAQKSIKSKMQPGGSPREERNPSPPPSTSAAGAASVDAEKFSKLSASYESLLVSNHQLTLQFQELRKLVEQQSKELRVATAQAAAAQAAGLGLPPQSPRPASSITKRPFTAASPTSAWFDGSK